MTHTHTYTYTLHKVASNEVRLDVRAQQHNGKITISVAKVVVPYTCPSSFPSPLPLLPSPLLSSLTPIHTPVSSPLPSTSSHIPHLTSYTPSPFFVPHTDYSFSSSSMPSFLSSLLVYMSLHPFYPRTSLLSSLLAHPVFSFSIPPFFLTIRKVA